jgi:hypothetical protein
MRATPASPRLQARVLEGGVVFWPDSGFAVQFHIDEKASGGERSAFPGSEPGLFSLISLAHWST